jgi:hypothetical protein
LPHRDAIQASLGAAFDVSSIRVAALARPR